jgi:uncharacterized membrane protein
MSSFYNRLKISKTEFLFQFQSHPNYPSILAFSDTLNFLNIKNEVYEIDQKDWHELPKQFITIYNNEYTIIEKLDDEYLIFNDKTDKISKDKLHNNSENIVFLLDDIYNKINFKKTNSKWVINFLFALILLYAYIQFNIYLFIYNMLSLVGLFVSLELFNNKFGKKSIVINTLCSSKIDEKLDSNNNCSKIFDSDKLNFKGLKLSDFSLVYFLVILVLGTLIQDISLIIKYISFWSVFVIFYSLYIQMFIERVFCKICLLIIIVLSLQITISALFFDNSFEYNTLFITFICFLSSFFIVRYSNDILIEKQKYYEISLKNFRFKKNYDIFKRELQVNHYEFENRNKEFWIGNKNSRLHISLITNPYCGFCKEAILILKKIVKKYPEISIQLRFNYLSDNKDENLTSIISIFRNIYKDKGQELLFEAIEFWHNKNDIEIFKKKYNDFDFETEINDIIKLGEENKSLLLTYTPQILINNYLFPNIYEREDIFYFIDEILDDGEILNKNA